MLKAWDGEVQRTSFLNIESSIEWSMIMEGGKQQIRSVTTLTQPIVASQTPRLVMLRFEDHFAPFVLDWIRRETLGDISDEDILEEGHSGIQEFKRFWMKLNEIEHFSPHERVWAYRFHRFDPTNKDDEAGFRSMQRLACLLFPSGMS